MSLMVVGVRGSGMGAMSTPERARELKAVLDSVATHREARAVAEEAIRQGSHAAWLMSGFLVESGASGIIAAVKRVQAALAAVPLDDEPVGSEWIGSPGAPPELRRAIEGVVTYVWAQERAFPDGTGAAEEWAAFSDGFVGSLRDSFRTITSTVREVVSNALDVTGPLTKPLLIGAGVLGGYLLLRHLGYLKGASR